MTQFENRYSRQQFVPQMGAASADALAAAHVLIVGAGGLGSPVSLLLAGAGVGRITLVDADTVSLSNLHRQILFQESDVGQSKVLAAKKRLSALNSSIEINTVDAVLDATNVDALVAQATVVVDAADNFLASYLLSDTCLRERIPLVSASVLTTHGYLGVFCGTKEQPAPSLRAVFPTPSAQAQNCNTAGVTGPSVGIIGSYQAQEVLKVIMTDDSQLLGKLLYLELWDYSQNVIDFSAAEEPSSYAPIVSIGNLSQDSVLLDVRSAAEVEQAPMPRSAINIPLDELEQRAGELNKQAEIACVCASGQRALSAAKRLTDAGFLNVVVTSR